MDLNNRRTGKDATKPRALGRCPFKNKTNHTINANNVAESYEKCPFGSLLSFIRIMYFHIHGIRSRVEQGPP